MRSAQLTHRLLMKEQTRTLLEGKLAEVLRFIDELEQVTASPFEHYSKDFRNARTAERDLELLVELGADIATHLILEQGGTPPRSYRDAFLRAGKAGILSMTIAEHLAVLASLRNRIVHEYDEEFDPRKAYTGFVRTAKPFRVFAEAIYRVLKNAETSGAENTE